MDKNIREWVEKSINLPSSTKISFKSCLFIHGYSGIGKTYLIEKICKDLNLFVINFTLNNCSSSEEFNDLIIKSITSSFLQILTSNNNSKIIIIDNYDSILSIDRTINSALYNILNNEKYKHITIICICNNELLKKLGNIKKKCLIIEYLPPNNDEYLKILKCKFPNIDLSNINEIFNINNNISQAIKIIENNDMSGKYAIIDKTYNLNFLYSVHYDNEIILKLLYSDTWLIPLRFHENLINELKNRSITINNKNEYYKNFIYNICYFDLFMNKNCINEAINFFSCMIYQLSLCPIKKNKVSNIDNFTKLLSYLSLQKKNTKKAFTSIYPIYQISIYHINMLNINLYT